jgi:hypothetical protein
VKKSKQATLSKLFGHHFTSETEQLWINTQPTGVNGKNTQHQTKPPPYTPCCNYQLQTRGEANCVARSLCLRARHEQMVCRGLALRPLSRLHRPADLSFTVLASESQILASFKLSRSSLNYPTPCNYSFRRQRRRLRPVII